MRLLEFFNCLTEVYTTNPGYWYDKNTNELHEVDIEHARWVAQHYDVNDDASWHDIISYAIHNLGLVRMVMMRHYENEFAVQAANMKDAHSAVRSYVREVNEHIDTLVIEVGENVGDTMINRYGTAILLKTPEHIRTFIRTGKIPRIFGEAFNPSRRAALWYDPKTKELHKAPRGEHSYWIEDHYGATAPKSRGLSFIHYGIKELGLVRMRYWAATTRKESSELNIQGKSLKSIREALVSFVKNYNLYPDVLFVEVGEYPEFFQFDRRGVKITNPKHIKSFMKTGRMPRTIGESFNPAGGAGFWYDHTKNEIHTVYGEHGLWMRKFLPKHIQNEVRNRNQDWDYDLDQELLEYAIKEYNFTRIRWYRNINKGHNLDIHGKNIPSIHEAFRGFIRKYNVFPDILIMDTEYGPDQPMWAYQRHNIINNPQHIKTFLKTGKIPKNMGEALLTAFKTPRNKEYVEVYVNPTRTEIGRLQNDPYDTMLRGFLTTDGRIIIWNVNHATHFQMAERLGLRREDVVGIYLWVDPKNWHYAEIQVTDFTSRTKWHHNPELADWIREHPAWWMDGNYIDIGYYDEAIVGPWEEL